MQQNHGTAVLFITHDLGVVSGFCDKVQVMYAGQIVETAAVGDIFKRPMHPYNRALQKSIPAFQPKGRELYTIAGLPPDLSKPITGCAFAPRCEFVRDPCRNAATRLDTIVADHESSCVRVQKGELTLD
jgi:oligopeptide transport system ATP-binding protein